MNDFLKIFDSRSGTDVGFGNKFRGLDFALIHALVSKIRQEKVNKRIIILLVQQTREQCKFSVIMYSFWIIDT